MLSMLHEHNVSVEASLVLLRVRNYATLLQCYYCHSPNGSIIAVLMPIRLPFESSRTPPELPGLMAASVYRQSNSSSSQT